MERQKVQNSKLRNKMTKDETTMAIEKELVRSPTDKGGVSQEVAKIKEEKVEEKKETKETKKEIKKDDKKIEKPKPKKTEAVVNTHNLPISTKYSAAICKFIKNKKPGDAIRDLEQVLEKKKAIPMKGEIPHRKGRIMSGRFPKKTTEHFIKILKSVVANANANELDNHVIVEAIANIGSRPFGRFGRVRRKRTHVKIKVRKLKKKEEKK